MYRQPKNQDPNKPIPKHPSQKLSRVLLTELNFITNIISLPLPPYNSRSALTSLDQNTHDRSNLYT